MIDMINYNWLVVWNHGILWLSIQLGISSSQLTNSLHHFQRGRSTTNFRMFIGKIMMDHGGFSCVSPVFFALFLHPLRHHQSPASSTSGQFYVSDMMWYALRYSKVGGFDMLWHIFWHVLTCWLVFHAHGMEFFLELMILMWLDPTIIVPNDSSEMGYQPRIGGLRHWVKHIAKHIATMIK